MALVDERINVVDDTDNFDCTGEGTFTYELSDRSWRRWLTTR